MNAFFVLVFVLHTALLFLSLEKLGSFLTEES